MSSMGNNSIRSNLSKEDMISDINLMRGANSSPQTVFLVVEGRDDIVFFQNRIRHDINLYESFSGCEGVKEIIEFFSTDNVIGICDRDYDAAYTNQHLFFYDHNCLEMMLISSDAAFNSVCATCYAGELSFTDLRLQILKDLKLISLLRKINSGSKMGINFKRMSISDLYSKQQQAINVAKIKDAIQSNIIVEKRSEIAKLLLHIPFASCHLHGIFLPPCRKIGRAHV